MKATLKRSVRRLKYQGLTEVALIAPVIRLRTFAISDFGRGLV